MGVFWYICYYFLKNDEKFGQQSSQEKKSVEDRDQRNSQQWWGAIPMDVMGSTAQRREVRLGERRGGSLSKTRRRDAKSDNRKEFAVRGSIDI